MAKNTQIGAAQAHLRRLAVKRASVEAELASLHISMRMARRRIEELEKAGRRREAKKEREKEKAKERRKKARDRKKKRKEKQKIRG